jgi:hypothetical protein
MVMLFYQADVVLMVRCLVSCALARRRLLTTRNTQRYLFKSALCQCLLARWFQAYCE